MRRSARIDQNQPAIVQALRAAGASVWHILRKAVEYIKPCRHLWLTDRTTLVDYFRGDDEEPYRTARRYYLRCEHCGNVKVTEL